MKTKTANKILFLTTILSIGIQFFMAFIGIRHTTPLLLGGQLPILLVPIISVLFLKIDIVEELRLKDIKVRTIVFAFLVILCAYPTISLLNMISMFFVDNAVAGTALNLYQNGYFFSMLVMAFLPAIGEEFLMRGVMYHSYRKKSPILAWILTSVIFGLFHMNFNQMPYAIFLGLIMVAMLEASDSLAAPMFVHFFMNGIATTAGYFSASTLQAQVESGYNAESIVGTGAGAMEMLLQMAILAALTLPLVILVIGATFKINGRKFSEAFRKKEADQKDETHVWDIWLLLSIVIMMILTVINTLA
ncbi:MAG: CPBP family intramembrane metalloprotease [Clostridia bacterium]|nr:type II CAAX endopeptidase family protein [Lachnospiraceae bacterium]NCC01607.1 CPBP family intramembrane metalloprotease [Clostridia bacterium]